jgi:hypothetical protein
MLFQILNSYVTISAAFRLFQESLESGCKFYDANLLVNLVWNHSEGLWALACKKKDVNDKGHRKERWPVVFKWFECMQSKSILGLFPKSIQPQNVVQIGIKDNLCIQ